MFIFISKQNFSQMSPLALISVSDKTNLVSFSKVLVEKFGYKILSSGGTAEYLSNANIPVIKVSDFTNSPEILEGRVKTLHPKIHGGILAKRSKDSHLKDLKRNNIELIDLVVVNLYPFKQKIEEGCKWDEAIENIDIGGPSMIRSAAKNHEDVAVLVSHKQYDKFIEEKTKGDLRIEFKTELAFQAFEHTASYDVAISNWMSKAKDYKNYYNFQSYPRIKNLRYGENPHQKATWYGSDKIGWKAAKQLQGKELSYNNLLDLESALLTILEFDYQNNDNSELNDKAVVILKHNNPCGAAISHSLSTAFKNALRCDSTSAFGGIVAFNNNVDLNTAKYLSDIFLECVVAPSFSEEALDTLKHKKNLRLLELDFKNIELKNQSACKSIMGGMLIQDLDNNGDNTKDWEIVTNMRPSGKELDDLNFSWKICKHVKSNAIVIAKDQQTLGIGAGQMNRVGAARLALESAKNESNGAVLASDGFFPFSDTVDIANKFGIKAIIQPGGSIRDNESIKKCDELGISMILTNKRHFLH
tara:strand:+ start:1120 stop:2709 length:1590 start_codon:yes stop_codon:yes gene_type:complete